MKKTVIKDMHLMKGHNMQYRELNNKDNLSTLGFGCMRFPKKGNGFDVDEIVREITYAVENGVNYFDTAYLYPGSEEVLGKVLESTGLRDKINIASKMPHYLMKSVEEAEAKLAEQLKRLRTDHIDYYLMHMLPDVSTWNELKNRGIDKWLEEKKEQGVIRRIGFSYHGSSDMFIKLLHEYNWEFCQIQYNYMDENSQGGRRGLMEAAGMGIPVIIMEPLRGGRLVNALPKDALDAISASKRGYSAAEWAFRWLWDQEQVTTVLSGMNSMDMLAENIKIASDTKPGELTEDDFKMFETIKGAINKKVKVPCTGCAYCMPCPFGVDIPGCFKAYNDSYTDNYFEGIKEYFMCTAMKNDKAMASLCHECGKCEQHCPQSISIRDELKAVKKRFESPIFKLVTRFVPGKIKKNK